MFHRAKALIALIFVLAAAIYAQTAPTAGANVNMVSGIRLADGDPFLQRQNEVSIAVSSVNPQHLLAGANDYRLIDLDSSLGDIPGETAQADSWVSLFKSTDGGRTWRTTMVSGCPLNIPQCNDPKSSALKGLAHSADPTVRSGPYGSFFYSFLANNRGTNALGVIAVQRFFDLNNDVRVADDPFVASNVSIIDQGTAGQGKDKPWVIADVGGRSFNSGTCLLPTSPAPVPAFSVYVSYSNFVGQSAGNPHPQIYVASSRDCGATFEKPKKVSQSVNTNQGTFLTIDPLTGAVYVFWRQIRTEVNGDPEAIFFSKSTNGGGSWSNPAMVAVINPFDQGTGPGKFRTRAYPAAAVSVDTAGVSRVHVVWSQRGAGPGGAARIVMSTSSNGGATWPAPLPVDNNFQNQPVSWAGGVPWVAYNPGNPAGFGHQFQPSITFAGGRLTLIWLDQRLDSTAGKLNCPAQGVYSIRQCPEVRTPVGNLAAAPGSPVVFGLEIDDATPGLQRRHSLDVFGAQAVAAAQPLFQTSRVSQYLYGSPRGAPGASRIKKLIQQLQFNAPNLPLFQQGTLPFLGDYIDVTAQTILPTGLASRPYAWNTSLANKTVFHGAWTDNRDIIRPSDGNWRNYTPIKLVNATGTDITANSACVTGQAGMRNQNVYTASLFDGVNAFAVVNSKHLSSVPRQFNIVVQNETSQLKVFTLAILPPPAGVSATFKLGSALGSVSVQIPPASSITRTVWVTSANNPGATVTVNVSDGASSFPVLLNPDPAATILTANPAPDITNIVQGNVLVTNNDLTNNDLTNNDLTNNDLTNNDLTNNDLTNNDLTNNDLTNNDLTNNDLTNNDLTNNDLTNNDLTNNDLTNAAITDASFLLFNKGTSDVALNLKALMRGNSIPPNFKVQLIVHKTYATQIPKLTNLAGACGDTYSKSLQNTVVVNIPGPTITAVTDPSLGQFLAEDPSAGNGTIALSPQEFARVTYRLVYNQSGQNIPQNQVTALEFGANGVKIMPVTASATIVPIPLLISTLSLPPTLTGAPYSFTLGVQGGLGTKTWSQIGGTLPPGIFLSAAGQLSGTPTTPGQFTFTVKVSDQSTPNIQTDQQTLTLTIQGVQSLIFPAGPLVYRTPLALPSVTGQGLAVNYSVTTGPCTVSANTITPTSGTGSCTIQASNPGTAINVPLNVGNIYILNPAPLTVTANAAAMIYGAPLPAFGASFAGLLAPDTPASLGMLTYTTPATSGSPVGIYPITPAGLVTSNYSVTYVAGTLTVVKALLAVAAENKSRTYGEPNPLFSALITGFQNGETLATSGVTGSPSLTTTASTASNAGSYPIVAGPGTLASGNYSFSFINGVLVINKATPVFSNLTSPSISQGTATAVLGGTILFAPAGSPPVFPAGNVTITMNSASQAAAIGAGGGFSSAFATGALATGVYNVSYNYGGDSNFNAAATGTATLRIFGFEATGSMNAARSYHTATLLPGGKVLVAGGTTSNGQALASAEVYDPAARTFTPTVNNMPNRASGHTATLLPNGKVLLLGGGNANAQLYDPASNSFSSAGGSGQRTFHTAVLLGNGLVLIAGGSDNAGKTTNSAQIYNPQTGAYSATGSMVVSRDWHSATLLPDGRVLIAGGRTSAGNSYTYAAAAEIYNPATGVFSATGSMDVARFGHAAALVDGKVLIAGGANTNTAAALSSARLYDPATGTWSAAGAMNTARRNFTATALNATVLAIGGFDGATTHRGSELFQGGAFGAGANMITPRLAHKATVLSDGSVLVAGGEGGGGMQLATAELYAR